MYCAEENLHHFENEIDKVMPRLEICLSIDDLTPTVTCRITGSRARLRLLQF